MIPVPIALLTLFYGVMVAVSSATVWKIVTGAVDKPLIWPMMWLAVSGGVMCGLPLLKPWARLLAIGGSIFLGVVMLSVAALLVMHGRPLGALAATLGAGVHGVIIRYLIRYETPV